MSARHVAYIAMKMCLFHCSDEVDQRLTFNQDKSTQLESSVQQTSVDIATERNSQRMLLSKFKSTAEQQQQQQQQTPPQTEAFNVIISKISILRVLSVMRDD